MNYIGYLPVSALIKYNWYNINYKVTDNLALEAGANIFFGDYPSTFFGQFQNNTNIYTALRYNF